MIGTSDGFKSIIVTHDPVRVNKSEQNEKFKTFILPADEKG